MKRTVPIYEGNYLPHAVLPLDLAGPVITENLKDESCAASEVMVVFEAARHEIAIDAVEDNGEVHLMQAIQGAMDG